LVVLTGWVVAGGFGWLATTGFGWLVVLVVDPPEGVGACGVCVCEAVSIAPPPVLGCPVGWGSAGTRGAVAEWLGAAGASPPLSAWATPPLASRAIATCPDAFAGGNVRIECREEDEVEAR
jgi:hypothetical protein